MTIERVTADPAAIDASIPLWQTLGVTEYTAQVTASEEWEPINQEGNTLLNGRMIEIIYLAVKDGLSLARAFKLVGITQDDGNVLYQRGLQPAAIEDNEGIYYALAYAIDKGRAEFEANMVSVIANCGRGGNLAIDRKVITKRIKIGMSEPTDQDPNGEPIFEDVVVERQETTKQTLPDWKAAVTLMERRLPKRWAPTTRKDNLEVDPGSIARDIADEINGMFESVPLGDEDE